MRRWNCASDLSSDSMGELNSVRRSSRRAGLGVCDTRLELRRAGGSKESTLREDEVVTEGRGGVVRDSALSSERDAALLLLLLLNNTDDGEADGCSEELESSVIFSESRL